MLDINITKDKLIKLNELPITYNILNCYYEKDAETYKYVKMYKIRLQDRPQNLNIRGLESKESDIYLLGKVSNVKTLKVLYDLTEGHLNNILDMNNVKFCCPSKKQFYVTLSENVLSENMELNLICRECLGRSPKINRIDSKLIEYLQDNSDSIANYVNVELFIASVLFCVDTKGWVYDKVDTSNNTSILAWSILMEGITLPDKYLKQSKEYLKIFKDEVFPNEAIDDFNIAIKLLVDNVYITYKNINTVVFLYKKVYSYKDNISRNFIGTIGSIFRGDVTFKKYRCAESFYGTCNIYEFDYMDSVLVWITNIFIDLDKNKKYSIKGIIKKHNIYQGIKQNQISSVEIKDYSEDYTFND